MVGLGGAVRRGSGRRDESGNLAAARAATGPGAERAADRLDAHVATPDDRRDDLADAHIEAAAHDGAGIGAVAGGTSGEEAQPSRRLAGTGIERARYRYSRAT